MSKSAVDAILAEAMDACALDHIAKLNTAHLSSSSLPSDLESRFRKLKSLPAKTTFTPAATPTPTFTSTKSLNFASGKENNAPLSSSSSPSPEPIVPSSFTGNNDKATDSISTTPDTTSSCVERKMPVETQTGTGVLDGEEVKPKKSSLPDYGLGSGFSPIKRRSLSPKQSAADRLGCCFFLSPKKASSTTPKSKGKDGNGADILDLNLGEEDQDDLQNTRKLYAVIKEQQKKLKKALKEQDKVNRQAAKLVRQSKEASARMRINTEELFSDEDEDELGTHFH